MDSDRLNIICGTIKNLLDFDDLDQIFMITIL